MEAITPNTLTTLAMPEPKNPGWPAGNHEATLERNGAAMAKIGWTERN